jgi:glycosyltransferase involved in cell wall biosynthesis
MASFQQSSPAASPLATVLIPTHKHKNTIQWAIRSVQDQSFSNFELFVVSDGAPPMVRDTVLGIASADSRIRYFEGAKGEGNGEMNRNRALLSAHGQIVCYCADDDLWLSHHLASMVKFLSEVDFGHSRTVEVDEFGRIHSHGGGMDCPAYRDIMRRTWHINPGLTVLGHTMAAYRQVPGGWQPAPPGVPSDLNMIRRFFAVDGLRFGTLLEPSTLRFVCGH